MGEDGCLVDRLWAIHRLNGGYGKYTVVYPDQPTPIRCQYPSSILSVPMTSRRRVKAPCAATSAGVPFDIPRFANGVRELLVSTSKPASLAQEVPWHICPMVACKPYWAMVCGSETRPRTLVITVTVMGRVRPQSEWEGVALAVRAVAHDMFTYVVEDAIPPRSRGVDLGGRAYQRLILQLNVSDPIPRAPLLVAAC